MLTGRRVLPGSALFIAPQAQGMVSCSELLLAQLRRTTPRRRYSFPHARPQLGESSIHPHHPAALRPEECPGLSGERDCLTFAEVAEQHPEFAAELPGFQAAVWEVSPLRACRVPGFAAAHDPEEAPETSLW